MKILIVDDDPRVVRGITRVLSSERDHWEYETAGDGETALVMLGQQPIDVVLTDIQMPGLDGITFLKQVGEQYPNVVRVILTGQTKIDPVMRAIGTMHQFLTKPCDADRLIDLFDQVEMILTQVTNPQVLNVICRVDTLPSPPEIVGELKREIESEESSPQSVARILTGDPNLAAKVLQLANSPLFGLRQPVTGIDGAVRVIGFNLVQSLAMSSVFLCPQSSPFISELAAGLFDHSLEVALLAKKIAISDGWPRNDDLPFSAGLLHDVGKLALAQAYPESYEAVYRAAQAAGGIDLSDREADTFGATHAATGAYLLSLWGLPKPLIEIVAGHHGLDRWLGDSLSPGRYVYAANRLARGQSLEGEAAAWAAAESTPQSTGELEQFQEQFSSWESLIS